MDNVSVNALDQAVEASGAGHAVWSNLTASASTTGLSIQTPTSSLSDAVVQSTTSDAVGISVLGGHHEWSSVVVEKSFTSADRSSLGLKAWYSDLTLDRFTSRNVSTGMLLEDSSASIGSMEANIGHHVGLHLKDSTYVGQDLTTLAQDGGVLMEGASSLQLSSWTAQLHNIPESCRKVKKVVATWRDEAVPP